MVGFTGRYGPSFFAVRPDEELIIFHCAVSISKTSAADSPSVTEDLRARFESDKEG